MKKLVVFLTFMLSVNVMICQVTPSKPAVPEPVKTKFSKDYPNVVPNWNLDGGNYQAEYYDQSNNLGRTVVYDRNGTIIREDHELGAGDFPTAIGDYYTQNFPNESYRVWSSEDVSGNRVYYGKCKDQVAWFDKEGKYMQNKPVKTGPSKKERNRPAGKAGKK